MFGPPAELDRFVAGCIDVLVDGEATACIAAESMVLGTGPVQGQPGQNPMTGPSCIVREDALSAARLPLIVIEGLPAMPSSLKWHSSRP